MIVGKVPSIARVSQRPPPSKGDPLGREVFAKKCNIPVSAAAARSLPALHKGEGRLWGSTFPAQEQEKLQRN